MFFFFGLLISSCVFTENKKFNNSTRIFPVESESIMKLMKEPQSIIYIYLSVLQNGVQHFYISCMSMHQVTSSRLCNVYFHVFNQFYVHTLKCCAFWFYSLYGSRNTMIVQGKNNRWNEVKSELSVYNERFKNDQMYVVIYKNSILKRDSFLIVFSSLLTFYLIRETFLNYST